MSHRSFIRRRYGITTFSTISLALYLPFWVSISSADHTSKIEPLSLAADPIASADSNSPLASSDELTLTPLIISRTNSSHNTSTPTTIYPSSSSSFPPPIPLPPGQTPPGAPSPRAQRDASLVNVYFLLLGLFILVVIFGWWGFHKRKKKKIARLQDGGRSALARDLEGLAGTRRWIYGGWGGMGASNRRSPEEGLDANGEAPPPYKPSMSPENHQTDSSHRNDTTPNGAGTNHTANGSGSISIADTLSIPLRTLSGMTRGMGWGRGPPDYEPTEASRDRASGSLNVAPPASNISRPAEKPS